MARYQEDRLARWAQPPSETENEKCENAVRQISAALRNRFGSDVEFIRQGSHKNRTNIKHDSDIDLVVMHKKFHFAGIDFLSEADKQLYWRNRVPASYPFEKFKADVHEVLKKNFGILYTHRKDKCIRLVGNSTRVHADIVPAFSHKRYSSFGVTSAEGIGFMTDKNTEVTSFPEHHYANGVLKNEETSKAYKAIVRIMKNMRNDLIEKKLLEPDTIPSFFIESLVWNVPTSYFNRKTWQECLQSVSAKIWNDMRDAMAAKNYAEVSNLHWLFRGQKRTPKEAEDFALLIWQNTKP